MEHFHQEKMVSETTAIFAIPPLIVCGPSGAGKTAVKNALMARAPDRFGFSISITTRQKRPNEIDGKDYFFLTHEEFCDAARSNQIFEYQEVYKGVFYGTLNSEITRIGNEGKTPLLDIDVLGAIAIIDRLGNNNVFAVAISAPLHKLEASIIARQQDSKERIRTRMEKAPTELQLIKDKCDWFTLILPRKENAIDGMVDHILSLYDTLYLQRAS